MGSFNNIILEASDQTEDLGELVGDKNPLDGLEDASFQYLPPKIQREVVERDREENNGIGRYDVDTVTMSELIDVYGYNPSNAGSTQRPTKVYPRIEAVLLSNGMLNKDKRILDYPSGLGHGSAYFTEAGYDIQSAEPYFNSNKKNATGSPTYTSKDGSDIPSNTFDVVINAYFVNVVPNEIREQVLRAAYDSLIVGGVLVILTMSMATARGERYKYKVSSKEFLKTNTFQRGFSGVELIEYCRRLFNGADCEALNIPSVNTCVVVTKK